MYFESNPTQSSLRDCHTRKEEVIADQRWLPSCNSVDDDLSVVQLNSKASSVWQDFSIRRHILHRETLTQARSPDSLERLLCWTVALSPNPPQLSSGIVWNILIKPPDSCNGVIGSQGPILLTGPYARRRPRFISLDWILRDTEMNIALGLLLKCP